MLPEGEGAGDVPVLHLGVIDTFVPSNPLPPIGTSLVGTANEDAA
jgi:hypothetical protein